MLLLERYTGDQAAVNVGGSARPVTASARGAPWDDLRHSGVVTTTEQWWLGALATQRVLDLGPEHPSRAGLVGLTVDLDDDRHVTAARIQPGFLHRGAEKLFEVRDYRQVLMLADRHDWQASFSGELVAALACEQLLGLSAPERAVWLRTLLAEVARIGSHLGFLSYLPHAAGDAELASRVRRARDAARDLMLSLSGNRLHPMLNRLGGLAADAPAQWWPQLEDWLVDVESLSFTAAIAASDLPAGLGHLDVGQINHFGISGPAARASGVALDLRRSPGYLAYGELDVAITPVPDANGDIASRFAAMEYDIQSSVKMIQECAQRLQAIEGPVNVKLSRIIKLPDAEVWLNIEAPFGIAGIHLVSRGGTTPWRFKLRTPTFAQVNVLQQVLVGVPMQKVPDVVASFGYTIGDLDK